MATIELTEDVIREGETATQEDLRHISESSEDPGLQLTGIEVLGFLAAKVAIPIICGFVSRVLYDAYKDMQTNRQIEQARHALVNRQVGQDDRVDEDVMRTELTATLVREGLTEQHAREVVDSALDRIRSQLT